MFTTRELTFLALLAAVNSVIEISLGSLMHAFGIPGKSIILLTINLIVYYTARSVVDKKGSIAFTGFVIAFIKAVYGWEASKLGPAFAIMTEALVVEACLLFMPVRTWSACASGAVVKVYALFLPLIQYLVLGQGKGKANIERLMSGFNSLFPALHLEVLILIGIVWAAIVGAVMGYFAYKTAIQAAKIYRERRKAA